MQIRRGPVFLSGSPGRFRCLQDRDTAENGVFNAKRTVALVGSRRGLSEPNLCGFND